MGWTNPMTNTNHRPGIEDGSALNFSDWWRAKVGSQRELIKQITRRLDKSNTNRAQGGTSTRKEDGKRAPGKGRHATTGKQGYKPGKMAPIRIQC